MTVNEIFQGIKEYTHLRQTMQTAHTQKKIEWDSICEHHDYKCATLSERRTINVTYLKGNNRSREKLREEEKLERIMARKCYI